MEASIEGVMRGKRGLVMGVANNRSLAWGIASTVRAAGAELALTYQGDALKKRVEPLAAELQRAGRRPLRRHRPRYRRRRLQDVEALWGGLDFLVHAIAFSDKDELTGRYVDTTREQFLPKRC